MTDKITITMETYEITSQARPVQRCPFCHRSRFVESNEPQMDNGFVDAGTDYPHLQNCPLAGS